MSARTTTPIRLQSVCAALLIAAGADASLAQTTRRISDQGATQANGASFEPAIAPNGNRAIFTTEATNLRPGGNIQYFGNSFDDVYLWGRSDANPEGGVSIVSVRHEAADPPLSARYQEGNGHSRFGAVVNTYFVFATLADNLLHSSQFGNDCEDTNDDRDLYTTGFETSTRESVDTDNDDPCGLEGNGHSDRPAISANGELIAFESDATNFATNDTNGVTDIYITNAGSSDTTNRVSIQTGFAHPEPRHPTEPCRDPAISEDGTYVAFETADGNMVTSDDNGLSDVYRKFRGTGFPIPPSTVTLVSSDAQGNEGNGASFDPTISANGQVIAFTSVANNLGPTDTNGFNDIYARDYTTGERILVSVSSTGEQANGHSSQPSISGDGRFVAFTSFATNLVANDTNGESDVFVHDLVGGATWRVSVSTAGTQGNDRSLTPSIDGDGNAVAFTSDATNLVAGDTNGVSDIFVRDIGPLPPTNDTCGSARPILHSPLSGTNVGATTQGSASCAASGRDVWFVYTSLCSGRITVSTAGSDFDTVLSIHSACDGVQLACNDDGGPGATSIIENFLTTQGTNYYIRLAGFVNDTGNYQIDINTVSPANDDCANAQAVGVGTHPFNTCFAFSQSPGASCPGISIANDVWFRYVAAESGPTRVETCGAAFDTRLAVYANFCPVNPDTALVCNDNDCGQASGLVFNANAGAAYLIRVGGPAEGPGTLRIIPVNCPADWDQNGVVNSNDYFAFLTDFFNGDADFNDDGVTNSDDYFAFLDAFFNGCE